MKLTIEQALNQPGFAQDIAKARKYRFVIDSGFSFVHLSFRMNAFQKWIVRRFLGWRIEDITK